MNWDELPPEEIEETSWDSLPPNEQKPEANFWKYNFVPGSGAKYAPPEGLLQKTANVVAQAPGAAFKVLEKPYQWMGEPVRQIAERGRPLDPGEESPNIFTMTNRLIRTGAAGASKLPQGIGAAKEAAQQEYWRDPGVAGVVNDVALALFTGKVSAKPLEAMAKIPVAAVQTGRKLFNKAAPLGRKALGAVFGPSEEAIAARTARPAALKAAQNEAEVAKQLERGYGTVRKRIKGIEERSVPKVLRKSPYLEEGAKSKDDILNAVENTRREIGQTVGPNEQYTKGVLDNISENLKGLKETVSESQLRDIIRKTRKAISYGKKEYGDTDIALMKLSRRLDRMLKSNKEYRGLMAEEAKLQRLGKNVSRKFGFERAEEGGLRATDTTATKLKGIFGESKEVQSQNILRDLTKETGVDYMQNVKDYQLGKQFMPGATRPAGSRRTLGLGSAGAYLGYKAGGGVGASAGSMGGALAGMYLDTQGGAVLGKLIDGYLKVKSMIPSMTIEQYIPMVQQAIRANVPLAVGSGGMAQQKPRRLFSQPREQYAY